MKSILLYTLLALSFMSFKSDNFIQNSSQCGLKTIINSDQYLNAPSDNLNINRLEIEGNCLTINFSAGGCGGFSWEVKLIDEGIISGSNPSQRNLRLSLKNEELCEALRIKTISFDISNLQIPGNQVLLNITNNDSEILYEY